MEKIKNHFVRTTHFYNLLEEICYDILECAIRKFCTLTKEGCVADTEKEGIKQLRDRNYKYAINKPGYVKNGMFMCRNNFSQFWDVL